MEADEPKGNGNEAEIGSGKTEVGTRERERGETVDWKRLMLDTLRGCRAADETLTSTSLNPRCPGIWQDCVEMVY